MSAPEQWLASARDDVRVARLACVKASLIRFVFIAHSALKRHSKR